MSRQDFMKGCKGQNPKLLARGKQQGLPAGSCLLMNWRPEKADI